MTKSDEIRQVSDVQELLSVVELDGVEMYELHGIGMDRSEAGEFEDSYYIRAAVNISDQYVKTRFTMKFSAQHGEYDVDLAVRYRMESEAIVTESIAVEFAERVGVMAAFPFLRENVFSLATRLGHPVPVLGLIHQGQFKLQAEK